MRTQIPAWVDDVLTPVEKLKVHVEGLRHMAVSVFVLAGEEILIQRRALSKYHTPGLWANTCCTHPFWQEAPEVCANRRLEEEMGITGLALTYRGQVEYRAAVGGKMIEHEVVDIYVTEADRDLAMTLNPSEVHEALWLNRRDLLDETRRRPERFTPWLRIYLEEHADRIFGDHALSARSVS